MDEPAATEYRITAHNSAAASENRIHSDEVARGYGFLGGLVHGVGVYAYASHALLEAFGPAWVRQGATRIRFLAPCYDGDEVTVVVSPDGSGSAQFTVTVGERLCATGSARAPADGRDDHELDFVASGEAPAPEDRPAASEEVFVVGKVLGSIRPATDSATASAYLARVGERATFYPEQGIVHPGLLLEAANRVLSANVVLPPWLHVESEVRHRRAVSAGEQLEVRARVAEVFERKGHRFVGLDVIWLAGPETVADAHHTAIWQLAAT